ncbi:hypothetical protein D8674_002481 [Pyrus ussuriensis x Pyrus communis]|uniref:Uncharacterized protein n=1 Tax=Pyrus ussuriensis x Pyrus communis TaxID=2448454 RepID=A0A5N5FEE8_9ROSA|nr:hypothetical protein D8674_002481 [Pyrus ussuriensis x Pyrus communis]
MDAELHLTKSLPAIILRRNSSTSSRTDPEIDDEHRYTSLKDIMLNSPQHSTTVPEENDFEFDPSNITIRNKLVQRAASAYVQSALLASSRNQNFIVSFWEKALGSRWYAFVRNPIDACFRPILQFLACMVGNVRSTLNNIPIS